MICLRFFFLSFLFSCFFVSYTPAQAKPLSSPSPVPALETKRFESKEGNFSIDIFQFPLQTRELDAEAARKRGLNTGKQLFWQFEKTVYTIMYDFFTPDEVANSKALDQMNSGSRMGIERRGGKIISEKDISFGKYPGTEFRVAAPNGVTHTMRNYLVNNMGYLVTAGYVDEESEKEALKVLDSFKLLTEKN